MAFGCAICRGELNTPPEEALKQKRRSSPEDTITATPCGHVFHTYCINTWLKGKLESSSLCPFCRKVVPKLRCVSLYPTTYESSIVEEFDSDEETNQGSSRLSQGCGKGPLLKTKVRQLKEELEIGKGLYKVLCDDYEVLRNKCGNETKLKDEWMVKAKQFESYKDLAEECQAKVTLLEQKLKEYSDIDRMLKGVNQSVGQDIVKYPPTPASIKTLSAMKNMISREHQLIAKQLDSANKEKNTFRTDISKLNDKVRALELENEVLKKGGAMGRSNVAIASPSPRFPSTPVRSKVVPRKRRLDQAAAPSPSGTDVKPFRTPTLVNAVTKKIKSTTTDFTSGSANTIKPNVSGTPKSTKKPVSVQMKTCTGRAGDDNNMSRIIKTASVPVESSPIASRLRKKPQAKAVETAPVVEKKGRIARKKN